MLHTINPRIITTTLHPYHHVYFLAMTTVDKKLLDILVCPVSKKHLSFNEETNELICEESGLAYPIKDGIPVMLPEEARKI